MINMHSQFCFSNFSATSKRIFSCHINQHIYFHVDPCTPAHINIVVDMHTDSLSFKFYEDPFFGCREIAEINMYMHYSNFINMW